jgi:hypothetical protein
LQLFKTRWIAFEDIPNINSNSLPNYTSNYGGVNVVKFKRKKKVFMVTMDRLYDIVQVEYLSTKKWIRFKKEWQFLSIPQINVT